MNDLITFTVDYAWSASESWGSLKEAKQEYTRMAATHKITPQWSTAVEDGEKVLQVKIQRPNKEDLLGWFEEIHGINHTPEEIEEIVDEILAQAG